MIRTGLLMFALAAISTSRSLAADEDAALTKACPDLAAWAASHPHGDETDVAADAGRQLTRPELGKELAARAAADTQVRDAAMVEGAPTPATMQAVLATDADNLAWLKSVVARQGFPTPAQVGERGMSNAWLLIQHADRDQPFQREVLRELQRRGANAGVSKQDLAMLTDRVLLAQGKPQRFGTQFAPDATGALAMRLTEDPGGLDARRASMGLMPIALYRCVLGASYHLPVAR
jgi:hypothetical protein